MKIFGRKTGMIVLIILVLGAVKTGISLAAEFGGGDLYRLPANSTMHGDLYLWAEEAYIDGTIDGDLYASGGYIEINGVVTGDVVIAGGGIVINGRVGDDVRIAGAGIDILGSVQDDLFIAGGGRWPGSLSIPFRMGSKLIRPGVRIGGASEIGGDTYVAAAEARIEGAIGGDLFAGIATLFMGAHVGGNAHLRAGTLTFADNASVAKQMTYATSEELSNAEGIAPVVIYEPVDPEAGSPNLFVRFFRWLLRTILILFGFVLFGGLLLRFAPNTLVATADSIDIEPRETALYGLAGTILLLIFPILSGLLVLIIWLFWGAIPAIATVALLVGAMAVLWFLSPLITGLWLGRRAMSQIDSSGSLLIALLMGVLIIVGLGRIPYLGWLIYLISFVFALGSLVRLGIQTKRPAAQPSAVVIP